MTATIAGGAPAQAATFLVNENSDQLDELVGDGRCDGDQGTPGKQCSLRAALSEANHESNRDRIEFDPAVFDRTHPGSTIVLSPPNPLSVGSEVTIDGGDCPFPNGTHHPCVGIDAGSNLASLHVGADDVKVKGIAFHGAGDDCPCAGLAGSGSDGLVVVNSWFGSRVGGFPDPVSRGIWLLGGAGGDDTDGARIGGKAVSRANIFQGGGDSILIAGGDRNRVLGNRFNVDPDGLAMLQSEIAVSIFDDGANRAVGNEIGNEVSRQAAATPECDGGCNVISNASASGVVLTELGGRPPRGTLIQGNFIGLTPAGTAALENAHQGIFVGESIATRIGGPRRARNHITGGLEAIDSNQGVRALVIKNNFIGLDSAGQTPLSPPDNPDPTRVHSSGQAPAKVIKNRFAIADATNGLTVLGEGAVVTKNAFGIARDGSALPTTTDARAMHLIASDSVIGKPGAGNLIGNLSTVNGPVIQISGGGDPGDGDSNRIQGNLIGADGAGSPHPVEGDGVVLSGDADSNLIGGGSKDAENVISNVSGWPILIRAGGESPSGNRIRRNRGKGNGTGLVSGMFINLRGADGFGNGDPALNDGIEAPTIDGATTTQASGSDAEPNTLLYVFQTRDPAGASPTRIDRFLARTAANGDGDWVATFDPIRADRRVTALQLDLSDGSSELALAVEP